jgi:hypothetical protein
MTRKIATGQNLARLEKRQNGENRAAEKTRPEV